MGPLKGIRVIEFEGIGPGPFAAMLLSDMGAEVLRVDRTVASGLGIDRPGPRKDVTTRGRRSIALDLKNPKAVETALRLIEQADALIEGFRPGVMERLGLGPEVCLARNPRLVFGRMTGFGQTGPLKDAAGHDINYIALAGALFPIGSRDKPFPPLNLVGDYGGGAMFLAFGIVCALLEAKKSGQGQVVDAAMTDGAAYLTGPFYSMRAMGIWQDRRASNVLDGAAPFYDTYETKDGQHVAIGAIEPKFYAELIDKMGLKGEKLPSQMDVANWPKTKARFAEVFRTKTREEWCAVLEGSDACFAPILSMAEAPKHPHNVARGAFVEQNGFAQPAPAPRFSRTRPEIQGPPPQRGEHTDAALADWGFAKDDIATLRAAGAIG
jgi:alpha-methylacyl-CoA racemase